MDEWREMSLGDVLTLQRGFDITKKQQRPGRVPVVSSSGIASFHDEARAQGPGVVIGRKGTLGSVFFIDGPYWPHDTTLWVRDFKGNDPFWCSLLLKTLPLAGLDAGSSNPTLNRNHAHTLRVRVPDAESQRRIASLVATFDELIEINDRRIELLEDLAKSLYREWFVRFRFPGSAIGVMAEARARSLPAAWAVRSASDVFVINPRLRTHQSSFSKVSMADVDEHNSVVAPSGVVARAAGSRFQRNDVLFARITPCLENGKTALVKFLRDGEVAVGSTEFIVLRGRTVGPAFTYCAARSEAVRDHAIKSMSGASGRQRVSLSSFDSLELIEPPPGVADAFERKAGPMLDTVFQLARHNVALAALRDLLLPRLVTGQLDISDIDLGDLISAEPV